MNKKTLFQIFLLILVILFSILFYLKYFVEDNIKVNKDDTRVLNEPQKKIPEGNIVKDLLYESSDNIGNRYIIRSDSGAYSDQNKNEILMKNVQAEIRLNNGDVIYLKSQNAIYNTVNSNTQFVNNVKLKYLEHEMKANNIDVFFDQSKLAAYNNLVYKNSDVNLLADKVEIDLLTRNSKIFMFDKSKVKIIKE